MPQTLEEPVWKIAYDHIDWLIIEHPDGRAEDMGYVDMQLLAPISPDAHSGAKFQFQWRTLDKARRAAMLLGDSDLDDNGHFKQPFVIDRPDCQERWHVGSQAHQFAREIGRLVAA